VNDRPYMTCRELSEFLLAYLDDELPEMCRADFERHLAACPSCVRYLATYRASVRLAQAALSTAVESPADEMPPDLIEAIRRSRHA